jgi:hypothetical protein
MNDRFNRQLQRLIEQAQPESSEDLQKLLDSLIGAPLPNLPAPENPEDQALDLVDQAWENSAHKGKQLAESALKIWPDCIPAYEYLAFGAKTDKLRLAFIEKGVEIGQRVFGGQFREKNTGHFWLITETRPYMRCLNNLALLSAKAGNVSKAIVIWEDMLVMSPSDNLGVRYSLLPALLLQRDLKLYSEYRKKFPEATSSMAFNDALARFLEEEASTSANAFLKAAVAQNPYVAPLLLHRAPPNQLPASYALQSPEEAQIYASIAWRLWQETPGALDWLKGFALGQRNRAAAQPLDQLPREMLVVLLEDPLSPISPLQLRAGLKDEDVAHLPMVRLVQALLNAIQGAKTLKLTPKGNLPRALVKDLYDLRLFPDEYVDKGTVKLLGEENFIVLNTAHSLCRISKLVQKRNGKANVTKKGSQMLQSPALLYQELLQTYALQYNWAYTERWSMENESNGQVGWSFLMYELLRQGDTPKSDKFYSKLYFDFFLQLLDGYADSQYFSAHRSGEIYVRSRFFKRFGGLFGLIEVVSETKDRYGLVEEMIVRRSNLAERVFAV